MSSIFLLGPSKNLQNKAKIPIKTRVIWVPGISKLGLTYAISPSSLLSEAMGGIPSLME